VEGRLQGIANAASAAVILLHWPSVGPAGDVRLPALLQLAEHLVCNAIPCAMLSIAWLLLATDTLLPTCTYVPHPRYNEDLLHSCLRYCCLTRDRLCFLALPHLSPCCILLLRSAAASSFVALFASCCCVLLLHLAASPYLASCCNLLTLEYASAATIRLIAGT
jgi:hypothetical protein